jgi:hypothetical protein
VEELADGALVVELPFAGTRWLVREILKEAGDAAILEPEDARQAVLDEVQGLAAATPRASSGSGKDGGAKQRATAGAAARSRRKAGAAA